VKSIADRVVERAKAAGFRPIGVEGQRDGEWVLVDLNDVLVHVMLPRVREFYGLEELWETAPAAKPRAKAKARASNRPGAAARKSAPAKGKSRPARGAPARKPAPARSKRAGKSARPRG
jgi:hypothetical protein